MNISAQSNTSSRQISPDIKVTTDHTSIILGKKLIMKLKSVLSLYGIHQVTQSMQLSIIHYIKEKI